jgi:hypothetical protein
MTGRLFLLCSVSSLGKGIKYQNDSLSVYVPGLPD